MIERPRKKVRGFAPVRNFALQPSQDGELRRRGLFWLPAPLPVLGVVYLSVGGTLSAPGWTILLAACVGVGTLLLATVVQPTPLPEGLTPQVSARRSLHRFRQFTALRIALALVTVLIGAAAAIVGGGMYPLFASLALAWPQLLMAMPTFLTITRARRAMEAWGTTAYLWHGLSRPAKVTWPIATPIARTWRSEMARVRAWRARVEAGRRETANRTHEKDSGDTESSPAPEPLAAPTDARAAEDAKQESAPTAWDTEDTGDTRDAGNEPAEADSPTGTDVPLTATAPMAIRASGPRATVNRAARQIIEQGGALGMAVRRDRRGTRSTRRPPAHKP